jgi:hypothetical protein
MPKIFDRGNDDTLQAFPLQFMNSSLASARATSSRPTKRCSLTNNKSAKSRQINGGSFAACTTNITIWTDFLNLICQFIQEWGRDLVPEDICVATIHIKESLGIAPTFQE